MGTIEDTIMEIRDSSSIKIKEIIANESSNIKNFPKSFFGVKDSYLGVKDIGVTPRIELREGIFITKCDSRIWLPDELIFLLPSGVYRFDEGFFEDAISDEERKKYPNLKDYLPILNSKREYPLDYLTYAMKIADILEHLQIKK